MRIIIAALALAALGIGAAAQAQSPVDIRQADQERQIKVASRTGKLNPAETARLQAQQRSIAREKTKLRARDGGQLTKAHERMILERQRRVNRDIAARKHAARGS